MKSKSMVIAWSGIFNFLLPAMVSASDFTIDLGLDNYIPPLCQLDWRSCGPAVTQMALQGYPGNVNKVGSTKLEQEDLFRAIAFNNDDVPLAWWTEPDGLQKTLMQYGADAGLGVNWVVVSETDPDVLMYQVAYWIEKRKFPVPVVTDKGAHWVLITGFHADAAPSNITGTGSEIGIDLVYIMEPASEYPTFTECPSPEMGGIPVTVFYTYWTDILSYYWNGPIDILNSKWDGKFVAVIEPPLRNNRIAKSWTQNHSGPIIQASIAVDSARNWLSTADTSDRSRYKVLRFGHQQDPLLVNANRGPYAYYIVPIGDNGTGLLDGAVLVNAHSGELQEIAVFPRARKYLSEGEALKAALDYTHANTSDLTKEGELIFRASDQAQTRIFPLWKFLIRGKEYYVSQSKHVYAKLTRQRAGN